MLEETGFIAREEGDEFLILTCPWCWQDMIFTQRADPVVIREAATTHVDHCTDKYKRYARHPRMLGVAVAGR